MPMVIYAQAELRFSYLMTLLGTRREQLEVTSRAREKLARRNAHRIVRQILLRAFHFQNIDNACSSYPTNAV